MPKSRERRLLALFLGLTIGLAGALVVVWRRAQTTAFASHEFRSVRRAAMDELIARSSGTWDSYRDADVGRVLLPGLDERMFRGKKVSSNRMGMRERTYELPKHEGQVRVVLVGDSYVFGYGVEANERLGVHLRRFLMTGTPDRPRRVEVLHLAISGWNLTAETSYVRRQLDELMPDLVVLVTFENDLADLNGVRGFGEMARFSPQARRQGGAIMNPVSPLAFADGKMIQNHLTYALDHESRQRYAAAADGIRGLADALERYAQPFLLVIHWKERNRLATELLAPTLRAEQLAYIPHSFAMDSANWNGDEDRHWNPAAHEQVAKLLYGLIRERELLPELELREWDEGRAVTQELVAAAEAELADPAPFDHSYLRAHVTAPPVDRDMISQVYYGYRSNGRMQPHSSVILARGGGDELLVAGASLGRHELEGAVAHVLVEEFEVGTFPLGSAATFPYTFALPPDVLDREQVSVRIECSDFVYENVISGEGASFLLEEIRIR